MLVYNVFTMTVNKISLVVKYHLLLDWVPLQCLFLIRRKSVSVVKIKNNLWGLYVKDYGCLQWTERLQSHIQIISNVSSKALSRNSTLWKNFKRTSKESNESSHHKMSSKISRVIQGSSSMIFHPVWMSPIWNISIDTLVNFI